MSDSFDHTRATETVGATQQFLTFAIGKEEYAVDIMTVREIKGWTETTRLPNAPGCMRGVMNLRGLIVPIFDLRARFGKGETQADSKHVIIILAIGERHIGMLVDTVSDILAVGPEEIRPAPLMSKQEGAYYIRGVLSLDHRMVVLLAIDALFEHETLTPIPNVA